MFSCLCRAFGLGFRALGLCSTWPRKHCPCRASGRLDARKHRPCHALATWALEGAATWPRKHRPCHALATWTPENSAPAVLWLLGRSKGLLEAPLGAPGALEWAARAPTWCPQNARRGCTNPRSMPPGHSKGLLEPPLSALRRSQGLLKPARCPRRLQVGAQASAWYPPCVQSAISTTCLVLQRGARATSCVT